MSLTLGNIILLILLLTSAATANIIHVPQDQPTIQAGIDAAVEGDTVLVDTGTFVDNISFNGKNIGVGRRFFMTPETS